MRPTIGLALIAKNEEHNLARLLESVKGCFDEIHLTDTGSTDNTVKLAKELGCIVHHFDWIHDFAAARNYSFSHLKTDYIAWLDLDDVLQNPDAFIAWRDNAMSGADYWIATYHYASDHLGRSVISFARERVIRRTKGFQWKYFLHEGIMPLPDMKVNVTHSWAVKHMRTAEDVQSDKGRNIKIFEANMDKMDSRMSYYYGKELFENQNAKESIKWFGSALKDPKLEMHDRILAIHYCCFALMVENKLNTCIDLAHTGLQLAPQRADFHALIGDCYLKMGKLDDAIPYLEAAKNCENKDNNGIRCVSPMFAFKDMYNIYPRNQLARVFVHLGWFDRAEKEAKESADLGSEEGAKILAEIIRMKNLKGGLETAVDCDDVVFTCPVVPYEWDSAIAKKRGVGGSEQAAIEMSEKLRELTGRRVIVFNGVSDDRELSGIEYYPVTKAPEYFSKYKPALHIAWRHNMKLTNARTLLWSHDLIAPGLENTEHYEKVLALSPFHKKYINSMTGLPLDKIEVTRNGVVKEDFKGIGTVQKDAARVIFSSSPDRGLDTAMKVMDEVVKEIPEATLHVYYGFENMKKMNMQAQVDYFEKMMAERPYVVNHGNVQHKELLKEMAKSSVWLYPTWFLETFCITALEMLACSVYPVVRSIGALQDTLKQANELGMATMLDHPADSEIEVMKYAKETISALREEKWKKVHLDLDSVSWASVAKEWADHWLQQSPAT